MGAIETTRGRLGLIDDGSGPATPIVFLHGVGSDKSAWKPQIDYFAPSRRALAFDYPGYGESDFRAGSTRDDFAKAILAGLDAAGIEQAHVCGLSLGGVIALKLHAIEPRRCRSLILADSFAVHPDGAAIYQRSVAAARTQGMAALAQARAGALLATGAPAPLQDEVVATMSRIDPEAYVLGAEAVWLADQRDSARAVRCPTLVLVGREDTITSPALSEDLTSLIDHARLEQIPGAGHLSNLEQPASFNRAINAFLLEIE